MAIEDDIEKVNTLFDLLERVISLQTRNVIPSNMTDVAKEKINTALEVYFPPPPPPE